MLHDFGALTESIEFLPGLTLLPCVDYGRNTVAIYRRFSLDDGNGLNGSHIISNETNLRFAS